MSDKPIKVLVAETMKSCEVREVSGLHDMQRIVGGDIEAAYPFQDTVAVVCNADGKYLGLPFNRPLLDESGLPYDIVCGTFFLAGLGAEGFVSLTDRQIQHYKKLFDSVTIITAQKERTSAGNAEHKKERGKMHER